MISTKRILKNNFAEKYRKLIAESDSECRRLEELHSDKMVCRKGCTSCCMDFSIFPVEFFTIAETLKGKEINYNKSAGEGECPMLVDGLCSIYESRPFICRSHGLPLLSMGEDGWELSHCELNFTGNSPCFDETNTLAHDRFNSMLFILNKEYIRTLKDADYSELDLIPLTRLTSVLVP
jgi:Fe-S-cluster containining protein